MRKYLYLFLCSLFHLFGYAQELPVAIDYLRFVENKGQWNPNIRYKAAIPSGELIVQNGFIGYILRDAEQHSKALAHRHDHFLTTSEDHIPSFTVQAFKVNFVGANNDNINIGNFKTNPLPQKHITASGADGIPRNYFHGNDESKWARQVYGYEAIQYRNLYPGIDFHLFANEGSLKYEFHVAAHGNPDNIILDYEGVNELSIHNQELIITTEVGTLKEAAPYAYQDINGKRKKVKCAFKLTDQQLTFELGHYNKKHPLVIDPQLIFSTYSGSEADNWGNTACLDTKGNLYTGGTIFPHTGGINPIETLDGFPATNGAFQTNFQGGDTDIGILKFDSSGSQLAYATYIGGNDSEIPTSLISNEKGEIFILGTTASENFPSALSPKKAKLFKGYTDHTKWYKNDVYQGKGKDITIQVQENDSIYAILDSTGRCNHISTKSDIFTMPSTEPQVELKLQNQIICQNDKIEATIETLSVDNLNYIEWYINDIKIDSSSGLNFSRDSISANSSLFAKVNITNCDSTYFLTTEKDSILIYTEHIITTSITDNNLGTICPGYSATPSLSTNLSNSQYSIEWKQNKTRVLSRNKTFTFNGFQNTDTLYAFVTPNLTCYTDTVIIDSIIIADHQISKPNIDKVSYLNQINDCDISDSIQIHIGTDYWISNDSIKYYINDVLIDAVNDTLFSINPSINDTLSFELVSTNNCFTDKTSEKHHIIYNERSFTNHSIRNHFILNINNFDKCSNTLSFTALDNINHNNSQPVGSYTFENGSDIIVIKLSEKGDAILSAMYMGGNANDGFIYPDDILCNNYGDQLRGDINIDDEGYIYVVSSTSSTDFPVTENAFQKIFGGGASDGVIFKLDPNIDSLLWSSYLGGNHEDAGMSIFRDTSNNIFVSGGTLSSDFPVTTSLDNYDSFGSGDAYITNISNDGSSIINSLKLGTPNFDQSYFVQIDQFNNVYILGQTKGSYQTTPDVYKNSNGGIFIHSINHDLDRTLFVTTIGDTSSTSTTITPKISPTAFLVNDCENLFLAGWGGATNSSFNGGYTDHLPITTNAYQKTTDGSDFYMAVLHKNADSLLYATNFGSPYIQEHVDGGTSRFDKQGIVYQSVCGGCYNYSLGGNSRILPIEEDFPLIPARNISNPNVYPLQNKCHNCNNAVFKYDLANMDAGFSVNQICDTLTIEFKNTTVGGIDFYWDFGDGKDTITYNPVNVEHTYEKPGNYKVTLVATDLTTCIGKDSSVQIVEVIVPYLGDYYEDTICQGNSIKLVTLNDSTHSFSWYPAETLDDPSAVAPNASPDTTTIYYSYIQMRTPYSCDKVDSFKVNVIQIQDSIDFEKVGSCHALPTVKFTSRYPDDGNNFEWDFGDGNTSNEASPVHSYKKDGKYKVTKKVSNLYCFFEDEVIVEVEAIEIPNIFTPNEDGKNDTFEITGIDNTGDWTLDVYNRWGKRVFLDEGYDNLWNGGDLSDGTYYYLVIAPDGTTCKGWVQLNH